MTEQTILPVPDPVAELPPTPVGRASLPVRVVTVGLIVVSLLGLVAAPFFLWGWGFSWTDVGLLIGMYLLTALGITVGFHRLFVHRSFSNSAGSVIELNTAPHVGQTMSIRFGRAV